MNENEKRWDYGFACLGLHVAAMRNNGEVTQGWNYRTNQWISDSSDEKMWRALAYGAEDGRTGLNEEQMNGIIATLTANPGHIAASYQQIMEWKMMAK